MDVNLPSLFALTQFTLLFGSLTGYCAIAVLLPLLGLTYYISIFYFGSNLNCNQILLENATYPLTVLPFDAIFFYSIVLLLFGFLSFVVRILFSMSSVYESKRPGFALKTNFFIFFYIISIFSYDYFENRLIGFFISLVAIIVFAIGFYFMYKENDLTIKEARPESYMTSQTNSPKLKRDILMLTLVFFLSSLIYLITDFIVISVSNGNSYYTLIQYFWIGFGLFFAFFIIYIIVSFSQKTYVSPSYLSSDLFTKTISKKYKIFQKKNKKNYNNNNNNN